MGTDRIFRRWRNLVLALMFSLAGSCWAVNATSAGYAWPQTPTYGAQGAIVSTPDAACAWGFSRYKNTTSGDVKYNGWVSYSIGGQLCSLKGSTGAVLNSVSIVYIGASCPSNSLMVNGTCKCNTGFTDEGSQCTGSDTAAVCSDAKGAYAWVPTGTSVIMPGKTICNTPKDGRYCYAIVQGGYCGIKNGVKTCATEIMWGGGGGCTSTPENKEGAEAPVPCKGSTGTVNGVTVCVPIGSDPGTTVETSKTGSTTTSSTGGDSQTKQTSETTSCAGSKCSTTTTTTTTTTPSGGGAATTNTETKTAAETKDDYCTKNPKALQCKTEDESGEFGGSCSGGFTCEGDAIQCAIAKDQLKRNCEAFDKDTDSGSITNKALDGSDKLNTEEMKAAAKTGAVQVGSFDTNGRSWSRGCPADPVIAIPWAKGSATQWTIPFSRLCSPLQLLANAAMAITLLGSLAWVVGGSKAAA